MAIDYLPIVDFGKGLNEAVQMDVVDAVVWGKMEPKSIYTILKVFLCSQGVQDCNAEIAHGDEIRISGYFQSIVDVIYRTDQHVLDSSCFLYIMEGEKASILFEYETRVLSTASIYFAELAEVGGGVLPVHESLCVYEFVLLILYKELWYKSS